MSTGFVVEAVTSISLPLGVRPWQPSQTLETLVLVVEGKHTLQVNDKME